MSKKLKIRMSVAFVVALVAALMASFFSPVAAQADPPLINCWPQLTTCGYPTLDLVGPTGELTPYVGNINTDTANQVIEDLDIDGCIEVDEPGVVIHNVIVRGDCFYSIGLFETGASMTISNVEVACHGGTGNGISGWNFSVTDSYVHSCENAIVAVDHVSVYDSVLQAYEGETEAHGDIIQVFPPRMGQDSLLRIYGNLFDGISPMTSNIISDNTGANDVEIVGNFFGGAGAYTLYCAGDGDDWTVTGNRFYPVGEDAATRLTDRRSPGYGLTSECDSTTNMTWSGNFSDFDGATVNDDGTLT